ncbi:MAG: hypothetical protein IIX17_04200 [Tidjanibacter sp.]|nr:hypothetical protein [Tidjanibacter sp.]
MASPAIPAAFEPPIGEFKMQNSNFKIINLRRLDVLLRFFDRRIREVRECREFRESRANRSNRKGERRKEKD